MNKTFIALILGASMLSLPLAVTTQAASPTPLAAVRNPKVPKKIKFADATVDLDRIDMFERLDRELTSMAYTHGNTLLTIKRANRYFPVMAPILRSEGVPEDLLYLACIESYLNPRAVSPAKAAGPWQFMPATGKEFGLEVNDYVDERYDVEKSTRAAARYLKNAYKKYGNWESAAASYNGGQGRISSELASQKVNSAYDLWLVDETARYMFRLLAMKMILDDPSAYGYILSADQLYQPLDYDIIEVNTPVSDWSAWARDHGTTYLTLREHNPWIRAKSLPNKSGKTYSVRIPNKKSQLRSTIKHKTYNKKWVNK
ncbi:MAG: lytic transglycosylase domain-containing protein [Firmicutes bacterium]|nr:lytic transglycosylase domain-containing protein [Bacillota bacterium]MCM1401357.1 lytic transglycosylase domain-containing protein [Bacteroides sp.]MCM1477382.1 lytic transglycosylase domain-containing protein [Bacteroides sp.]